jgi:enoyl-CoA hydratase/carnithine racemase
MCNHTINALEAVSLGLASRIVPAEMVREELNKTAQKVAAGQPGSVRRIKGLVNISYDSLATHLEAERTHFVEQISTAEAKRSMKAFLKNLRRSEAPPKEE